MATYPSTVLDEIRSAIDIVDLVGRFVTLRKAGVNWKGLCPFHAEKTPSFMVNPRKGIFHCFGCGVGGDVFGFLMRQDRVSFPEAVRALAKQAGVELPEDRRREPGDSGREELYRVMARAAEFYADRLWSRGGERAREYLERRAVDREVARRFVLGYAPEGWDTLLGVMKGEGIGEDALVAAGLAIPRDGRSGVYDRFRGRLIFTIADVQGRPVAFGGRAFGDEQPKYLNSPETPLYTKGNLLYAADLARDGMRAKNRALLVEGYVDCVMAHQHGFTETVAALGTALTPAQLHLVRRYAGEAILFFDADAAGKKAAERAETLLDSMSTDAFWDPTSGGATWAINRSGTFRTSETLRVRVATLPAGHDPDTFLRAEGATALEERIGSARSLVAYALELTVAADAAGGGLSRAGVLARAALTIAKATDAEEAAAVSRDVAFKLGLDPVHLLDEARRLQAALRRPTAAPARTSSTASPRSTPSVLDPDRRGWPWSRRLVDLLLHGPDARATLLPLVDERDLEDPGLRAIVTALKRRPDAAAESLLQDIDDEVGRGLLSALLVEDEMPEDRAAAVGDFCRRLDRKRRLRWLRETNRSIAEGQEQRGELSPNDEFRAVHEHGGIVHQIAGAPVQSLEAPDPDGSPRSPDA
jgi:DNA primase